MAPSITETLFALGLGDRIVGVSPFCSFPKEAVGKPKVGGYLDPNYEAVVSLEPDIIFLLPFHVEHLRYLNKLGFNCVTVQQDTIDSILISITTIGRICHVELKAQKLKNRLKQRIQYIQKQFENHPKPSVMVVIGRNYDTNKPDHVYIAGKSGFHGEIIEIAGGVNVYGKKTIPYPAVSGEGIIQMNPDVIIEMVPELKKLKKTTDEILSAWKTLPNLKAVQTKRVYVFDADYVSIPGPRVIQLIEDIVRVLHPGVEF